MQLNAFSPALRDAVAETLVDIGGQCDGLRCDMAMLMTNEVFARTWGERAGAAPAEDYWPALIGRVKAAHPELVFIAEAYWDMEWTLQQQGFDYCYDKRLYDRLAHETRRGRPRPPAGDAAYQERLIRFIENHDEPRAAATFGPAQARAAAVVMSTLQGARLYHDGQLAGRRAHIPVFLGRGPDEPPDDELRAFYERLLRAVAESDLRDGDWRLCEVAGWPDNDSPPPARGLVLVDGASRAASWWSTSATRPRRAACDCRGATSPAAAGRWPTRSAAALRARRRRARARRASTSTWPRGARTSWRGRRMPADRPYRATGGLGARPLGFTGLAPSAMGERLGGFVYGTIVVLAVVVASGKAYPDKPGHVAIVVVITTVVFWLAHVYAHGLGHSIGHDEHLTVTELRRIARHELAIVEAGVPSVAALLLGAFGVLEAKTSIWLAIGLGLGVLLVEGLVFARVERLGALATLGVVAGNLALGMVLVAMKLLVTH